ncbi:TPA: DUF1202 family protein [Kluyvera ascorbata]|uniref:DUF1202 family protein n=1 Tax=Kluyvera ascorbata TaxID=51288 RepID=A0A3N2RRZ6_9ENTR|nr:DUF1202 family protein [Kluyvera ascorbata]BBV64334.1 hypothetical protein STW0522KLE44_07220 [Klebsiella sp. STW0522-44]MDU3913276.1 DUF1202 family protein [Kluyvera ascorbata]ROU10196.1 DUF1202 family protein [Kluyvera ascorbata]HAT7516160.1 DUF1202 family protein [Kluyvera ascorbata]HCL5623200.1 DUF1202 family protein [Kluyvera ascorbata]
MKLAWKFGMLLLSCFALHALADSNVPTDDVIKQQFAKQSGGMMQMDNLKLHPLDAVGNQATYSVEGDMIATDNLYSVVGGAGDYLFYERTWTKGHPVKFSAMMTAVGTPASGWRTTFFSMQMAAKNSGRPFSEKEDLSKSLVVNDSGFMAQFAKIDAQFAVSKVQVEKQQAQYASLKKEVEALDEQIKQSWGKDANGKSLDRDAVQHALNAEVYAVDRKNDMNKFANQYYINVFEPALIACQKKAVCDDKPIRAASDKALEEQKQEYYRQHNLIDQKNKAIMAEKDKQVAPLQKKRESLRGQMVVLESSNYELQRDETFWREGVAKMRKEGVIP